MNDKFKMRNPLLVLFWSYGLFVLMHTTQYSGAWIASLLNNASYESIFKEEIVKGKFKNYSTLLGMGLNGLIVGIPIVLLIVKYLWKRKKEWMCLKFNIRLLSQGAALGFLLPLLIIATLSLFRVVRITGYPDRLSMQEIGAILVGYLGWVLFTAVVEELVFRGMAIREWAAKWGWIVASIFGGIYFGLAHFLQNIQNMSPVSFVWLVFASIITSFLFVAMYIRSKSLWLPIGFHAGWNFALSALLGTTMSGKSQLGVFQTELIGPAFLTGGEFGIETSVVSVTLSFIIALLFWRYSKLGEVMLLSPKPENVITSSNI